MGLGANNHHLEMAEATGSAKAASIWASRQPQGARIQDAISRPLHRERRNSRSASFSLGLSFWNFSVTCSASPRCRRMASRSVTEAPSCISLECKRTPHKGAVRILLAVLSYAGIERFLQVI